MYTLGIPKRDYRRATQVLDYESQPSIPYNANLQDDGFYMFTFPEAGDEDAFRSIVEKLKNEGIRVIGADSQLTEKQIMKLADLIKESPMFGGGAAGVPRSTTPNEALEVELGDKGDRTFYIDPEDIKAFLAGEEVGASGDDGEDAWADIYNFDTRGGNARISKAGEEYLKSLNLQIPKSHYGSTNEGSCGYAPDGEVDVHNTDKMKPAGPDLIRKYIQREFKKIMEEPNEGNAYIDAMRKAKEAGEDEFEVDGEIHKVK